MHLHHSRWQYTLPVLSAARLSGRPRAVTVHSTGLAAELESMPGPLSRLLVRLLSGSDLLLPVSGEVERGLMEAGVDPPRLLVLPAFLPPSPAEADPAVLEGRAAELHAALRERGGALLLASAYNLGPGYGMEDVYGIELLARALAGRRRSYPPTLLVMVSRRLASPAAHAAERRIREALEDTGVRLELLFGEPLPPFLAMADAYVRPSRADGDSVALREALAMDVPSAASDVVERPPGTHLFPLSEEALGETLAILPDSRSAGASVCEGSASVLAEALLELLGADRPGTPA